MDQSRFIVIQEWMLDLGLNDSELRAFALVYGFSQDHETGFRGSIDYVAHWCQIERRWAIRVLKSLMAKGLITKQSIPGQANIYYAKGVASTPPVLSTPPVQFNAQGGGLQHPKGVASTPPNNIDDNTRDNIDTHSTPRAREDKALYGDHVLLTEAEHARLVQRYGDADTARLIEILDLYLANKTKDPYKSHYAAIQKWVVRDLAEQKTAEQRLKNAQEAGQRVSAQQAAASTWTAEDLARIRKFGEKIDRERNGLQ